MKRISKNKRGISLIVLVITIIVMIILAAAIILSLSGNGIIGRANEAKLKSDMQTMVEELSIKTSEVLLQENGNVSDLDGPAEDYLTTAKKYPGKYKIVNGKLLISAAATEEEKEIASELGITEDSLLRKVSVGEYIKYPYTKGGVEKELLCRVLYSDSTYGVQIVPINLSESDAGEVDLTYSNNEEFINLFNNILNKANDAAKTFINNKIAVSARALYTDPSENYEFQEVGIDLDTTVLGIENVKFYNAIPNDSDRNILKENDIIVWNGTNAQTINSYSNVWNDTSAVGMTWGASVTKLNESLTQKYWPVSDNVITSADFEYTFGNSSKAPIIPVIKLNINIEIEGEGSETSPYTFVIS